MNATPARKSPPESSVRVRAMVVVAQAMPALVMATVLVVGWPATARQSAGSSDALYYAGRQISSVGGAGGQRNVEFLPLDNCEFSIRATERSDGDEGDTVYRYRGSFRNAYLLRSVAGGAKFVMVAPRGGPVVTYDFVNNYNDSSDSAQVLPVEFSSEPAGVTAMNAFNRLSAECGLPPLTQ